MEINNLEGAVVGGGAGGSAAALLFARAGASVTLFERVARPRAIGASIAMTDHGLAVLESLGLRPALSGAKPVDAQITDANGRTLFAAPSSGPRMVMLRWSTLQGVLLDALASEPRVERHFGAELVRASPDGTAVVRAGDGERAVRAHLVIGADGVHSRVREGGSFGARVRRSGISYVRTLVEAGSETGVEAWTPAGVFGSFAVDDGTYAFASCGLPAIRAALEARDLDAFRAAWGRAYAPARRIFASLTTFDQLLVNEVIRVDCARWADGRLVLLGDAAHAMAPNLGQGANSALVDAAVLLDALRHAPDTAHALAAYERRRRPAVTRVASMAARLGQLAEVTNPVVRALRDRVLLPIAGLLSSDRTAATVLQEPTATLLAIGRA